MKKLFLVVDFQKDFVDGSLGFPLAASIEDFICEKMQQYRQEKGDVAFTLDTHGEDYLTTHEGEHLPVVHCVAGTQGHQLFGKVAECKQEDDPVFEKSTFPSLALAEYLKDHPYDQVELAGLVSHICVLSNAIMIRSALPNAKIIVHTAGSQSYDPVLQEKAWDVLRGLHIDVIS